MLRPRNQNFQSSYLKFYYSDGLLNGPKLFTKKEMITMKRAVCSLNFNVITDLSHLENKLYST